MIQIKSYYGDWKTVEREQAKRFVKRMIDGGCARAKIDGNRLRGISVDELLYCIEKPQEIVLKTESYESIPTKEPKTDNSNMVEIKDCVIEIETLARKEAFCKFEQEIMFSLMVWKVDELIRKNCKPVTEWIKDCIHELETMVRNC